MCLVGGWGWHICGVFFFCLLERFPKSNKCMRSWGGSRPSFSLCNFFRAAQLTGPWQHFIRRPVLGVLKEREAFFFPRAHICWRWPAETSAKITINEIRKYSCHRATGGGGGIVPGGKSRVYPTTAPLSEFLLEVSSESRSVPSILQVSNMDIHKVLAFSPSLTFRFWRWARSWCLN